MKCVKDSNGGRAMVFLYREELLYDIRTVAHIIGDGMTESDTHTRHLVQDIGEDGNIDRVTRMMDLAVAKAVDVLHPYTKRDAGEWSVADDYLEEKPHYCIGMNLPAGFPKTTLDYLAKQLHEYVVSVVMWDWLSHTLHDLSEKGKTSELVDRWRARMEEREAEVKSTLSARMGRVRKTLTPW